MIRLMYRTIPFVSCAIFVRNSIPLLFKRGRKLLILKLYTIRKKKRIHLGLKMRIEERTLILIQRIKKGFVVRDIVNFLEFVFLERKVEGVTT